MYREINTYPQFTMNVKRADGKHIEFVDNDV